MLNSIKKINNTTYTQNGAVTNASTLEPCLDFFAVAGALREADEARIIRLFLRAFTSTPDYAVRALFYARDVRGGLGERRVFRTILRYLATVFPETVIKNIGNIPEYGRYDDLLVLFDTPCRDAVVELIRGLLKQDEINMAKGEGVSLLAKWLPSVNASNCQRKQRARELAKLLGMTEKEYRKRLSALKGYIDILETRLCKKDYTFSYEKQPSKALYKYRGAFTRHDRKRYTEFINRVKEGAVKLNTTSLYPYEIIRDAIRPEQTEENISVLDATWNSLPDYGTDENAIAVIDGSGSMTGDPINIATSLGIYFAQHTKGYFHNHFITFSENPQLVEIHGSNIVEKALYCMSYNEIANTDLLRVFGLILEAALENNLPESELPKTIYVISDMEFDQGVCNNITLHEEVKTLFAKHGYRLPTVVYWNVNSHKDNFPVTTNEYGAVLVSGASPAIFRMVISRNITPLDAMLTILDSERYCRLCA